METIEELTETNVSNNAKELDAFSQKRTKSNTFKEKKCKVISFNKQDKTLDVIFDKFGIRIKNVTYFNDSTFVTVLYRGEIGKPNFEYKL